MFKTLVAAALLSLALPAAAQPKQQISLFGIEDPSCRRWTEQRGDAYKRAFYEVWILGFVSGHNYTDPHHQVPVGGMLRGEALHRFLDDYCQQDPSRSLFGAAIDLTAQLSAAPQAATKRGAKTK